MYPAKISGVGSCVPEGKLSSRQLAEMLDVEEEWIVSRTGIEERRVAAEDEATSDFAYAAALRALQDASLLPEEIDLILAATETPDHILPPLSCQLQHRLGCRPIPALDLHNTCVGFLSALQIAEQYIKTGAHKHVLVIGADTLTRLTDYTDKSTAILFGDGAGAVVLSRAEERQGIVATVLHSDGRHFQSLYVPGGGSRRPASAEHKNKMVMDGQKIFKLAVKSMSSALIESLTTTGLSKEEIDWVIPHQANLRIMEAVARQAAIPMEKVINTVSRYGNSCSATIPIALDTAVKDGRIKRGDRLAMLSFGAGLIWGAAIVEF
ncbi:beta-ketoacyl-ACP synthase III [Halalkalibacter oceani]|uniref:Beta-ketoacyl-[acyl-carrier-protein] synthase III n=1 Tax=Halalkalibacter oceani TaxID=1653776 RepID=A0A9X2IR47_9BACI|nr:beta-ketoacyl-ACP synthase III [Halalkalibacter oceani]MCM3716541.1 ketoacyl-ACP synthase III [Halalkalibacter oceani]